MSAVSALAALALMRRETELRVGPVARALDGRSVEPGHYRINRDEFLLWTDTGLGFHYRRSCGVTLDQTAPVPAGEIELWHHGSVYAAIAALNGLVPLHASAVAHNGQVHAFAGPSGMGKSTLAAGLGRNGFPLFCDDTLLLDLSDPDAVWCLPGHKRLKLCSDALALTGAAAQEHVGVMIDKVYAQPLAGVIDSPLPLAALTFLADGPNLGLRPVTGGEQLSLLNDDHYTADYVVLARGLDRAGRMAHLAGLAAVLPTGLLTRPRSNAAFADGLAFVAAQVRGRQP